MTLLVKGLSHTYNKGLPTEHEALHDISFSVDRGEIVSILGHTGSGKSTLAQHLNGLAIPQHGCVIVDDVNTAEHPREARRMVGLVFQYPEEQIFAENVAEEVAFAPRNWGVPEKEINEIVLKALNAVGLDETFLALSPHTLSGGQKRRIAIASVIAAHPEYIVLDEPTAGLDSKAASDLINMLRNFAAEKMGIVHITHDIELALSISSKILVLEEGRAVSWASPYETAEMLCTKKIKGLIMPDLLALSAMLRDAGRIDSLCWDVNTLTEKICSSFSTEQRG